MENLWEKLDDDFYEILAKCNDMNGDLCRERNMYSKCILEEMRSRMELVHYKAGVVNEFIRILSAAEIGGFDLGEEITASASFYYANFIIDLRIEMEIECAHYFADRDCVNFIESWKNLCKRYKNYFRKKITLPKSMDLTLYQLAK